MNMESLVEDQAELKKQLYDVINEWMMREKCRLEPETALGMALGAVTEAAANYTATYRFHNRFSDEWSQLCCEVAAKVFYNSHYIHLQQLAKEFGTDELPPIN